MSREKSMQIPEKLFVEVARYFLLGERNPGLEESISRGLNDKLEAVVRHDLYTKYKTAPTPKQQEEARKEYLERAGIPQAFRW